MSGSHPLEEDKKYKLFRDKNLPPFTENLSEKAKTSGDIPDWLREANQTRKDLSRTDGIGKKPVYAEYSRGPREAGKRALRNVLIGVGGVVLVCCVIGGIALSTGGDGPSIQSVTETLQATATTIASATPPPTMTLTPSPAENAASTLQTLGDIIPPLLGLGVIGGTIGLYLYARSHPSAPEAKN